MPFAFKNITLAALMGMLAASAMAADMELRARFRTLGDMLHDPAMQYAHDTNTSDDAAAYRMVIGLNLAALGEKCDRGQIPGPTCDEFLTEMAGYLADKQISMLEIRPWLERIKVYTN